MRRKLRVLLFAFFLLAHGQVHGGTDFQITKITKNLITAPQLAYTGAEQYRTNQRELWLEVETTFASTPLFTDELTFKYFILLSGKVLTGEVTHVNIPAGRDNRSVMYVPPHGLARLMNNQVLTVSAVQNVAVQIVQDGAVKAESSLTTAPANWFAAPPRISGFLLNKNETPFAALYWDRYEQIKGR
jgi:hypothetical protein